MRYGPRVENLVNPRENGRGDRFRYDEEGQLLEAWYNAADPANSGAGYSRYDEFHYDELGNRRGWNHIQSRGGWMNILRAGRTTIPTRHCTGAPPSTTTTTFRGLVTRVPPGTG